METPFNFTVEDKPEPSSSGGGKKLIAGRYNLVFDRVANKATMLMIREYAKAKMVGKL